jgi:nicotinamidase-related amidase
VSHIAAKAAPGVPVRTDARQALLVLGMQNDSVHPQGFFQRTGLLTISTTDRCAQLANVCLLADAMRRTGCPVIHGQWAFRPDYLDCHFSQQWQRLGLQEQRVFVKDTPGAAFVDGLDVGEQDFLLPLATHSAFQFTALDRLLRNCGVEACVVVGGAAHESVDDTTRQGAAYGYRMLLVPEAIYPLDSPHLATLRTRAECVSLADALELTRMPAVTAGS